MNIDKIISAVKTFHPDRIIITDKSKGINLITSGTALEIPPRSAGLEATEIEIKAFRINSGNPVKKE